MKYGYMRVSTEDQSHDLQENALREAGCDQIYADKISGSTTSRPELDALLESLESGDQLVVWKLDRLGRSLSHLITLVGDLEQKGVDLVSVTDNIDTSTPMGRCMFHVSGAFAQMERELIAERTKEGIKAARAKNPDRSWGAKRKTSPEQDAKILTLRAEGVSLRKIAEQVGVKKGVVESRLREVAPAPTHEGTPAPTHEGTPEFVCEFI